MKKLIKNPIVSVIMPAYNAEKYIEKSIVSILEQTFKEYEFIIIDDCSKDETWTVICDFARKDSRIVALKNTLNLGIAGNRNKGVSLAKGKYVMWQDADDVSMPLRLENQYKFMESNEEVGIVGGFLEFFDDNGSTSIRKYAPDDKTLRKNIFRYSPVAQPAAMIRKTCLDEFGEYDLKYPPAEDLDMSFRIGTKYKFANLQEIVLKYRENLGSATFTRLKTIELNTIEIRRKYSKGYAYKMTCFDKLYNLIQNISIYIIPTKMKIWLFNFIRNTK